MNLWGGKKKVQKVQRVLRVVDCPVGNANKVSVTGLAFASPVLLDEEQRIGAWIR